MRGRIYIRTFGCQMNVKDSERMRGLLEDAGYVSVDDPEAADVILVNTCSVRKKPEEKALGLIGRWKAYKAARPEVVIGVGGCFAQRAGEKLIAELPYLDLAFGVQAVHRLPELIERARAGERIAATEWLLPGDPDLFKVAIGGAAAGPTAFVSIMQGCDNACAYCVVPAVRGRAECRRAADVVDEVRRLSGRGVREVTLLGQNVNAYRDEGLDFAGLLERVAAEGGIERVRFTTSHPRDLSARLIETMTQNPKVMEHIHLPAQAGSSRVLARMKRGYDRDHYLDLVGRLRLAMPEVGLTADFIVGFPGETEEDFQETLTLLEAVRYDETFSFRYSIREGTEAATDPDQVPEDEKYDRLYRLQALQALITEAKNREQVGIAHQILIEGQSKTDPTRASGRTRTNRLVHFDARGRRPGELVTVAVTVALKHSLVGEIVDRDVLDPGKERGTNHADRNESRGDRA